MASIAVTAVVGTCAPERFAQSRRVARDARAVFFPAARLAMSPSPLDESLTLIPWAYAESRAVVEFPATVPMVSMVRALTGEDADVRLEDLVCVVDAAHLLDDIHSDSYFVRRGPLGTQSRARSLVTVEQIEYASAVVLVGWETLTTPDLTMVAALISHLSPCARLHLHSDTDDGAEIGSFHAFRSHAHDAPDSDGHRGYRYSSARERPGWARVLSGGFAPPLTHARVSAFRYDRARPLHPERLMRVMEERVGEGEFGTVIRSAGYCRLATRPSITGGWEHAGQMFSVLPLTSDARLTQARVEGAVDERSRALVLGQDIALIGLDLDHAGLGRALDHAVLDDVELEACPTAWSEYADPFSLLQTVADRPERD